MATTKLETLRANLASATGFFYDGTNTGTGNQTVVDTEIQRWDTGRLLDRWVLMKAGNNSGKSRRIASVSSSTATMVTAWAGANANTNTFEILPYDPDIMRYAIQEACRTVWPKPIQGRAARGLYLPHTKYLVVDNLLLNSDFETFTTTFTSWTNIGTPTLTQSTRTVHGTASASIAASGAVEGIEQNILTRLNQINVTGKTLHVRGWTWDDAESSSRLRLTFDGSTFTNGKYNTGDGEWKGMAYNAIDIVIPDDLTEATISCEVADGETGLFKWVVAWVDPIAQYTMPTTFYPNGPNTVMQQVDEERPEGPYRALHGYATAGRILRLEGLARLTVLTTDSSTTEVDEVEGELLIAEAAMHMYRRLQYDQPALTAQHAASERTWAGRADDLRSQVGHGFPGANERIGWGVSSEVSRTLYLER